MADAHSTILPNDQSFRLQYKGNARVLDHRGDWTARLVEALGWTEWAITDNQIALAAKGKFERAEVGHKECSLFMADTETPEQFPDRVKTLLNTLFGFPDFGTTLEVRRLGFASRFCTPVSDSFEQLFKKCRAKYFELSAAGMTAIGDGATMEDIGATLVFRDSLGEFHTLCGPMVREQLKGQFFDYKKLEDLPTVGLFFYLDHFCKPEAGKKLEMKKEEILSFVEKASQRAWQRYQRVRKLIVTP